MAVGWQKPYQGPAPYFGFPQQPEMDDGMAPSPMPAFGGVGSGGVGAPSQPQDALQPIFAPQDADRGGMFGGAAQKPGAPEGDGDWPSADSIQRRRRLAEALMGKQMEVNHPTQAVANAVNQIAGAYVQNRAERDQQNLEKRRRDFFLGAMEGGGDFDAMMTKAMTSGDPELQDIGLRYKIAQFEAQTKRKNAAPEEDEIKYADGTAQRAYWDNEEMSWVPYGDRYPRWSGASGSSGGGGGGSGGGGSGSSPIEPTSQGGTFALPDGRVVAAPFVKGRGFVYRDADGQYKDLPAAARPVTTSAGGPMTAPQYLKLKQDREEGRSAMEALDKYIKVVGNLPQGMRRWANDLSAKFKTFMGQQNLTPDEFNQMNAWQKQQALIGLFRTTIVGPGVVTEYDAIRIIQALGGDPSSALQNPAVLEVVLNDLYQRKKAEVEILDQEYVRNAPYFGETPKPLGTPEKVTRAEDPRSSRQDQQAPQNPKMPKDKAQLKDGQVYTVNGKPYRWNAAMGQFEPERRN